MRFFLLAAAVGVTVGLVRGGGFRHILGISLSGATVVLAATAAALQLSLGLWPALRHVGIDASYALVAAALLLLSRDVGSRATARIGIFVLVAGWALNLIVIAANGGMPVSAAAADRAGLDTIGQIASGNLYKHVWLGNGTHLGFLGDVIPVPMPPQGIVLSVGDIVLILGFGLVFAGAVRPPAPLAGAGATEAATGEPRPRRA